jgi:hypothetical protein
MDPTDPDPGGPKHMDPTNPDPGGRKNMDPTPGSTTLEKTHRTGI